jgi:hypothetical protein
MVGLGLGSPVGRDGLHRNQRIGRAITIIVLRTFQFPILRWKKGAYRSLAVVPLWDSI